MSQTVDVQPKWQHDCSKCTFLGHYSDDKGIYDLYHCNQGSGRFPTIIARWSDNGPDYNSGMCFGKSGSIPALAKAYELTLLRELPTGEWDD